ncbi:MAG: GatB/YqeY domain-containing protein [Alphaproteobacteria bacterium]
MLRTNFKNELLDAMKVKDSLRVSTLRLILAAIKDRDLESRRIGNGDQISDSNILAILAKMVKQRNEAAEVYRKAERNELAETECKEIEIINTFMPKMLTKTEVDKVIEESINIVEAKSLRDLGKVISKIKENYTGRCDFADVTQMIRKRLER